MPRLNWMFVAAALLFGLAVSAPAQNLDQAPSGNSPRPPAQADESWYGRSDVPKITPRMIIQQKAALRAQQRIARMESMRWYGMSASRPRANITPFTGMASPAWQMPGGRPFAWLPYPAPSPVLIVR